MMNSIKNFVGDLGSGIKKIFHGQPKEDNLFSIHGRVPLSKAVPFGIQHVLAMLASNVTPILLVFSILNANGLPREFSTYAMLGALFVSGIGTVVQLLVGARLPIVIGTSFTFVPIFMSIAISNPSDPVGAYYTILGSMLAASLFLMIVSVFYKYWGKLIKPIVPAIVVLGIGFSLLGSGATSFFGGSAVLSHFFGTSPAPADLNGVAYFWFPLVAFITFAAALAWDILVKGVWKNVSILFGILFGFAVASCIPGMIDWSSLQITEVVGASGVFDYPHIVDLTQIRFELTPVILTCLCAFVAGAECIGDTNALSTAAIGRSANYREISGGLFVDGFATGISGLFGAFPLTTYSQNVGLVAQTKVVNIYSILLGAGFLVLASFLPPIANFIYAIPEAVIGGTMIILFGSIAVIGMKMIGELGWTEKNIMIASISACLGYGLSIGTVIVSGSPVMTSSIFAVLGSQTMTDLFSNVVLNVFIISMILSYIIPDSFGQQKLVTDELENAEKFDGMVNEAVENQEIDVNVVVEAVIVEAEKPAATPIKRVKKTTTTTKKTTIKK